LNSERQQQQQRGHEKVIINKQQKCWDVSATDIRFLDQQYQHHHHHQQHRNEMK